MFGPVSAKWTPLRLHGFSPKAGWRRLEREGRAELAQACYDFLPARAHLDILGWDDHDIFSHA